MKTLAWNEFVENVQQWAEARGIYEHSTPQAQLMKAFSEGGELADALIKGDLEGMQDAVGDAVVCLINYATMHGDGDVDIYDFSAISDFHVSICTPEESVSMFFLRLVDSVRGWGDNNYEMAVAALMEFCALMSLSFTECCTRAWNEIKDRTGRMVEGGAFVKDE